MSRQQSLEDIRNHQGLMLQSSSDPKAGAGCCIEAMAAYLGRLPDDAHPALGKRSHGCGSPAATAASC